MKKLKRKDYESDDMRRTHLNGNAHLLSVISFKKDRHEKIALSK